MYDLLLTINDPAELRKLERKQLTQLARELRQFLLDSVSPTAPSSRGQERFTKSKA